MSPRRRCTQPTGGNQCCKFLLILRFSLNPNVKRLRTSYCPFPSSGDDSKEELAENEGATIGFEFPYVCEDIRHPTNEQLKAINGLRQGVAQAATQRAW